MPSDSFDANPSAMHPRDNLMESGDSKLTEIAGHIAVLAQDGIRQAGYMLLSKLGISIGGDLQTIKARTGMKLAEFIRARLSDKFDVRAFPQYGSGVLAVCKAGVDPTTLAISIREVSGGSDQFRFHYRFWCAFAVPLPNGNQRFLSTHDFSFRDLPMGDASPDGVIIIPSTAIAPSDVENRDGFIRTQIDLWLQQNNWPRERVAAPRLLKHGVTFTAEENVSPQSLLHRLLEALDRRQLQQIVMPLDIIEVLLKKKV